MTGRVSTAVLILGLMPALPATPAWAAPANLDSLVSNSPFNPVASTTAGPVAETALEFRGVLMDGGEYFFSLYDPSTRTSMWVGLKEPGNPFTVQSYDAAKGLAQVEYRSRTLSLALKQAKVVALAGNPSAGVPSAGTPPVVAPAANPTEATRLAAVAEEIRRRRALRTQANQAADKPAPAKNN